MGRKQLIFLLIFLLPALAFALLMVRAQGPSAGVSLGPAHAAKGGPRNNTMANPQIVIGIQTTVPATGTDAPTSLNYPPYITSHSGWEIANPQGTIIAWAGKYQSADNTQGWTNQSIFTTTGGGTSGSTVITGFPLTPPGGTPAVAGYEIRAANSNGPNASAFFDVVPVRHYPLVSDAGQLREVTAADTVNVPGQLTVNNVLVGNINQIEITGTTYALTDTDGILHFTGASACTITLDATYPAKTVLLIKNAGTASLTVAAPSGMTMEGSSGGSVTLAAGSGGSVGGALTLIRVGSQWGIY